MYICDSISTQRRRLDIFAFIKILKNKCWFYDTIKVSVLWAQDNWDVREWFCKNPKKIGGMLLSLNVSLRKNTESIKTIRYDELRLSERLKDWRRWFIPCSYLNSETFVNE